MKTSTNKAEVLTESPMDIERFRVVAVGAKTPGILSKITKTLSEHNYEIVTISSLRLGHSIVVVCMIEAIQGSQAIENCLKNIVDTYGLQLTIDNCSREKHQFIKSDAFMRIRGSHIAGIKAYIISELIEAGLDIHGMESDTYDKNGIKRFVININGQACNGLDSLSPVVWKLQKQDINMALSSNWKLLV